MIAEYNKCPFQSFKNPPVPADMKRFRKCATHMGPGAVFGVGSFEMGRMNVEGVLGFSRARCSPTKIQKHIVEGYFLG